ncbi:unnamed protein product [Brugia timori]|uniref:Transmembrane protein n=1 Tax=Brugia timori TaxID=42155 RepID=A0A0R3QVF4_9BILA|nr:unnamed protein product [Brugia timori]
MLQAFDLSSLGVGYMFNKEEKGFSHLANILGHWLTMQSVWFKISMMTPVTLLLPYGIHMSILMSSTIELVYSDTHHIIEQLYQFETDVDTMTIGTLRLVYEYSTQLFRFKRTSREIEDGGIES